MLRRLLLGFALCGAVHAAPPPRIDLVVTPAWKGWSRPGRATELDLRLSTDAATRATLDLVAGHQSVHVEVDLRPGRVLRLQIPVGSGEKGVTLSVASAGLPAAPPQRREIGIAQSESPLLGVGLATGDTVQFDGFHTVALAADDLPRNASAYSSIDALILDAPTLAALDQRQLGALLAHAAACGRIVVVNTDPQVRRSLDSARACGGRTPMSAASLVDAKEMLEASLATSLPKPPSLGAIGELARPDHLVWNRVALGLAVYFAAMAVALMYFSALPVLLLAPALAATLALALLHAMPPSSRLVVWSEGESGAQVARYQAWQRFAGLVRARARVAIAPQLGSAVQACESAQVMHFDFDTRRGLATFAEFETRLFRQVSLCYAGDFPAARALEIEARQDAVLDVRNAGTRAWPPGALLARGRVHDLPALGPGAHATVGQKPGQPLQDGVARMAQARTQPDHVAALWALDLGGVADVPANSTGWLLVSVPMP